MLPVPRSVTAALTLCTPTCVVAVKLRVVVDELATLVPTIVTISGPGVERAATLDFV